MSCPLRLCASVAFSSAIVKKPPRQLWRTRDVAAIGAGEGIVGFVGTGDDTTSTSAFCRGCGYQLHGLLDSRCPECGRIFDPADARTYDAQPRERRLRRIRRRLAVSFALFVAVGAACYGCLWWGLKAEQPAVMRVSELGGSYLQSQRAGPRWFSDVGGPLKKVGHRAWQIDLANTAATDADVTAIVDLHLIATPQLRTLLISHTAATEEGLAHLQKIKTLQSLYVYGGPTTLTADDEQAIKARLPGIEVRGVWVDSRGYSAP